MNYKAHNHSVKLFKMMSNSHRLKVLTLLAHSKQPMNVSEIAQRLGIEITNLSNHLFKMRAMGLIRAKQSGAHMFYSIKDPQVIKIIELCE